ncbi:MAG: hypothetical protein AAGC95_16865 [Pseudomonadota bacterium]
MKGFHIAVAHLERVIADITAAVLSSQFKRHIASRDRARWTGQTAFGAPGLALSETERIAVGARCAAFFGCEDRFVLEENDTIAAAAQRVSELISKNFVSLQFATMSGDGTVKVCAYPADQLYQDAVALSGVLQGRRRIVSMVSAHNIVGFAATVVMAELQGLETVDGRGLSAGALSAELAFGDLLIATPTVWRYLSKTLERTPDNVMGASFGETMRADLAADLREIGLGALREIYGVTEMGLVAWRDGPPEAFRPFAHWRQGEDDAHFIRLRPDGGFTPIEVMDAVVWEGDAFHLHGRRDGAVQVGGVNVYPKRIGEIIEMHPLVDVCRVRLGRQREGAVRLIAHMVLSPSAAPSDSVMRDIDKWCRLHLRPPERPRIFNFEPGLASLPEAEA